MAFKRLTPEQFRALDESAKDDYRYAMERADGRTRALWFWGIGIGLLAWLSLTSDEGLRIGLLGAIGLWLAFLAMR